jgi:hypothetical protein
LAGSRRSSRHRLACRWEGTRLSSNRPSHIRLARRRRARSPAGSPRAWRGGTRERCRGSSLASDVARPQKGLVLRYQTDHAKGAVKRHIMADGRGALETDSGRESMPKRIGSGLVAVTGGVLLLAAASAAGKGPDDTIVLGAAVSLTGKVCRQWQEHQGRLRSRGEAPQRVGRREGWRQELRAQGGLL